MSALNRQPLSTLSTNRLHESSSNLKGIKSSKIEKPSAFLKAKSFPVSSGSITSAISNADKLKYRLKLAYYKLRTNQVKTPAAEILEEEKKKLEAEKASTVANNNTSTTTTTTSSTLKSLTSTTISVEGKQQFIKGTPSLTRHISLLAASTPLQYNSQASIKKKVSFNEPANAIFKIHKNVDNIQEFQTFKPPIRTFTVSNKKPKKLNELTSLNNLKPKSASFTHTSTTVPTGSQFHRSLKIDDLCNDPTNNSTIIQDDTDATIMNDATVNDSTNDTTQILEKDDVDVTPIRKRNGLGFHPASDDTIGSSPSKVYMSTPGSYKAAKSLLELGLPN